MNDIALIGISFLYIFAVLGFSSFALKKTDSEFQRKFIHIMVGNWVFIAMYHTRLWAAMVVPAAFIVLNALSYKYKLVSSMERDDDSLGTIYYPVSLLVTVGARFVTGWNILPLIGILIMAYGDGFAALLGAKYGKRPLFSFAPKKSIVGSATVALVAFLVTGIVLLLAGDSGRVQEIGLLGISWIALLTAFLSTFLEAASNAGCDNLTLPIGAGLFATLAFYYGDFGFYLYFIASAAILLSSLKIKVLTANAVVAAILTAVTLYTFGGIWIGLSLYVFFLLGSGVSLLKNENKRIAEEAQESGHGRTWIQVICNSLPACILVWHHFFYPDMEIFALLALGVFAAATADTFASELGVLSSAHVFDIVTGRKLRRGVSGGVSWIGTLAAIFGSFLLAALALPEFGIKGFFFVGCMGILGSLIDSVLGSLVQRKYRTKDGEYSDKPESKGQKHVKGLAWVSNNTVNLASLTAVAILGYVVHLFLPIL